MDIPLSLYIHLPWCERKCPYCDFNSHVSTAPSFQAYTEALWSNLEYLQEWLQGRPPHSLFIGGGTPSLCPGKEIVRLLSGIRQRWPWKECEVTMEANPGSSDATNFSAYRDAGVNRLSLGVQSFHDDHLRTLGRVHNAAEARKAVTAALSIFPRVNVDLMYGLPHQTLDEALDDVRQALDFGLTHLSCYQLTLEPGTPFYRTPPPLPSSDLCTDQQQGIEDLTQEAGLSRYEISAYALPGQECCHNLNYWQFGDYLGLGAGAHSKLSRRTPQGEMEILRLCPPSKPETYLRRPIAKTWAVTPPERPIEFMLNALRLTKGVPATFFQQRTGNDLSTLEKPLALARAQGLMDKDTTQLLATSLGRNFLNDLLLLFIPQQPVHETSPRRTLHELLPTPFLSVDKSDTPVTLEAVKRF